MTKNSKLMRNNREHTSHDFAKAVWPHYSSGYSPL